MNKSKNDFFLSAQKNRYPPINFLMHEQNSFQNKKANNPDEFLKLRFKTFPFIVDWQMQIEGTSLVNNKEELNH